MATQGPAAGEFVPITKDQANMQSSKQEKNPYEREVRQNDSSSQQSREPVQDHPLRAKYWIASLVLTALTLLLAIGSIVTAAVVFHRIDGAHGEAVAYVLQLVLYIVTMVEASLTLIAMIPLIVLLAVRPRAVLIRDKNNGNFVCLCASVFILFLFAVYSFCVPIICKDDEPKLSAAICIIPGVRFIALISFFAVLVANSKL